MPMNRTRRITAVALAVAVLLVTVELPVLAADDAPVRGRVFAEDGITPKDGVIVRLESPEGSVTFDSAPTSHDGSFRIDGAPAGRYALLARDHDQVFLASDDFEVSATDNDPVSLSLQAGASLAPAQSKKSRSWSDYVIAGAIAVAGLYLIYEVTKTDEESVSPN